MSGAPSDAGRARPLCGPVRGRMHGCCRRQGQTARRYFAVCLASLAPAAGTVLAAPASDLTLLGPDYPRVFFFRSAESGPSRKGMTYERWEGEYDRLMGIMGKCLNEEVVGRETLNPEWFSRFKRDNPRQAVLLHCNGNARDPLYAIEMYFPGHWICRAATRIVADVPAEAGETVIRVEDARRHRRRRRAGRRRHRRRERVRHWRGDRASDCGPANNATTDQGYWGDVKLARAGIPESELTPPRSLMTWVNANPFEASFYFRKVRSKRVDLAFRIEGSEPVTLGTLSAHSAPDARCRMFEHGLVLANPGRAAYAFDLAKLAPGRAFRRIRATPRQDAQANTGEPVGATVTLGPLEGLLLSDD